MAETSISPPSDFLYPSVSGEWGAEIRKGIPRIDMVWYHGRLGKESMKIHSEAVASRKKIWRRGALCQYT